MLGVLECAVETQVVTCGELQRLVLAVVHGVTVVVETILTIVAAVYPRHVDQFCRSVAVFTGIVDIQLYVAHIVQAPLVALLAEQLVLNAELRSQVVLLLLAVAQVGVCHGVAVLEHITEFPRGVETIVGDTSIVAFVCSQGQHVEVLGIAVLVIHGVAVDVVCIDRHVGHCLVCLTVSRVSHRVVVTGGEGHVNVRAELDAVADPVVQSSHCTETVEVLVDGCTVVHVITCTDTEGCLFATTRQSQVVVVLLTETADSVYPVGILVVVVEDTAVCIVVVQLQNALRGICGVVV